MNTCTRPESEMPLPEQVAAVAAFIPVFEDPGFCPGGVVPLDEDGLPLESFARVVSRFMDACYKNGFVVRFDWESWEPAARAYLEGRGRIEDADLPELRRLLTWHVRQNRFVRDHLATVIASGHVLAILRRLKDIRR